MTPDQIAVVQAQGRQYGRSPELADRFYAHLFGAHPQMRTMFPAEMADQHRRFGAELDALARAVTDLAALAPRAASLGRVHAAHAVAESHYEAAGEALLAALADVVPGWDDEAAAAWRLAFDLMVEAMLDGYE